MDALQKLTLLVITMSTSLGFISKNANTQLGFWMLSVFLTILLVGSLFEDLAE